MDTLAELLDSLAKRPAMYVGVASFDTVRAFLGGLGTGLKMAGLPTYSWEDYQAAASSRGWDSRGSEGIVRDFRRKELTDAQMVEELVAVEAEAYLLGAARRGPIST